MTRTVLPDDLFSELQDIEQRIARLESSRLPESVRVIGTTGQPAFSTGWSQYDNTPTFEWAGFYRFAGRVWLQGLVKKSTAAAFGDVIFTLPVGYRPAHRVLLNIQTNSVIGRVDVMANGDVVVQTANAAWLAFDGLSFRHA